MSNLRLATKQQPPRNMSQRTANTVKSPSPSRKPRSRSSLSSHESASLWTDTVDSSKFSSPVQSVRCHPLLTVLDTTVTPPSNCSSVDSEHVVPQEALKRTIKGRIVELPSIEQLLKRIGIEQSFSSILSRLDSTEASFMQNVHSIRVQARQGEIRQEPSSAGSCLHWFKRLAELARKQGHDVAPSDIRSLPDRLYFVSEPAQLDETARSSRSHLRSAILAFECNPPPTDGYRAEHVAIALHFCSTCTDSLDANATNDRHHIELLSRMRDAFVIQPLRTFILGLGVFKAQASLLMLDHEGVTVAHLDDCWDVNAARFACLATLLTTLSLRHVGLYPFAHFDCDSEQGLYPVALRADHLGDCGFDITKEGVSQIPVELVYAASSDRPFRRATVVLKPVSSDLQAFVFKFQNVDDERRDREVNVWQAIKGFDWTTHTRSELNSSKVNVMDHLAAVERAFIHERLSTQIPLSTITNNPALGFVTRRQTVVVYRNPVNEVKRLTDESSPPTPSQVVRVVKTLLVVLCELWTGPGVLHRDISTGNVLHSNGHLVLTDYDCAWNATLENSSHIRHHRTGTLDTMAVDVLRTCDPTFDSSGFEHEPRHDAESTVYMFLKVIWTHLRHKFDPRTLAFWQAHMFFDDGNAIARQMRTERESLWGRGWNGKEVVRYLSEMSPTLGRLVKELLRDHLEQESPAESDEAPLAVVKRLISVLSLDQAGSEALDDELKGKWGKYSKA
ncbi:hypothetical protein ACM66B_006789 [Microbotryomycetes sp. NB124-2]